MSLTRSLLLTELIREHVSNMIQFGFMMSFTGEEFVVCSMVSLILSYCDPTCVLDMMDRRFPT